ncbi:MAG: shikimate kinase [Endomicrobium sp.]|nr:shikimate kinase [Endomicrobium sp.]
MNSQSKRKSIIFTGFMGTGKTETGKIVAKKLNMSFFDTDDLIERKADLSINDIFKRYGEACFRRIETEVIKEISKEESVVIACGGGVVLNPENIKVLRQRGIIINLCASVEVVYERLKNSADRPLLKCKNPLIEIKKLLDVRKSVYADYDFTFNTDGLMANEVADCILNKLNIKLVDCEVT